MNRSSFRSGPLIWLVCIGTVAGQFVDEHNEILTPKDTLPELEEPELENRGDVPVPALGSLDSSMSLNSFEEDDEDDGIQDRGLFAAFEGSGKFGKYRGGGMFYGGRKPHLGDYGLGDSRYGGYYRRPFNVGYNGNRNRFPAGYGEELRFGYDGNRDRYPGRGFYRQPYPSPY